jgi:PAS domain S-box-containing protein
VNLRIVSQVWQWLVTPHPTIIDPRQRRRAELLATLMILLVPLVTLLLILAVVTDHGTLFWQDQLLLLILALLVAGSAIYGLSRTPYYLIGALLAIVLTTLGVFGSMLIIDQFDTQFLLYLIVPILLASFFISLRVATVLFGVFIAVFLLLPVFFPFITYANLLNGPLSTFVIVCAIVLLTRRFRNLLEDERWAAIERSERRYRIVSEMTSDYAYSLNVRPDGAIQTEWITQAFTTITGYTPEEANDWRSLIHPDDLPIAEARRDRLLRGEEDESVLRIVTKTGMVRWLREVGRPVWDDVAGRVVRIDGAATDITAAKEIQNSLELLEKAIHSAGEGVAIMALDALEPEIVFVNDGLLKITGATRADFVGQPFTVFADMMTDDDVLDRMIRAVRAGQSLHTQTDNYRLDHTLYNLEWHVTPVLNADQGITHFSAILRDVTQRTQAQLAEQDQRALAEALRDIAAGLTSTLDVDEVLDRILTTLSRVVPHDSGNITLIQNGTGVVVRRHTFGQRDQEAAEQYVIRDVPVLAEMLDTGRPYVLADTTLEWLPFPGAEQMQSYVGVPIQADRQVIGFLQLTSRQPQGFTSQHAERLEAFANLASIALRNAQSFKTKQQQAMELEKRVAEHTLELVEEQRRQQAILDSVGEGVFYTESGIILYVNPQLCQQTGYASEELVGQPTTLLQPEDDTSQWGDLATRLAEAPIWRGEVQVRQASGDVFDAGVTIARISEVRSRQPASGHHCARHQPGKSPARGKKQVYRRGVTRTAHAADQLYDAPVSAAAAARTGGRACPHPGRDGPADENPGGKPAGSDPVRARRDQTEPRTHPLAGYYRGGSTRAAARSRSEEHHPAHRFAGRVTVRAGGFRALAAGLRQPHQQRHQVHPHQRPGRYHAGNEHLARQAGCLHSRSGHRGRHRAGKSGPGV